MMLMVSYEGTRSADRTAHVHILLGKGLRRPLPLRLDLIRYCPGGFEWGKWGGGCAQLALALIAHASKNDDLAIRLHQRFEFRVVANLPIEHHARPGASIWRMSDVAVMDHIYALMRDELEETGTEVRG
jgi:hypothetical protein